MTSCAECRRRGAAYERGRAEGAAAERARCLAALLGLEQAQAEATVGEAIEALEAMGAAEGGEGT